MAHYSLNSYLDDERQIHKISDKEVWWKKVSSPMKMKWWHNYFTTQVLNTDNWKSVICWHSIAFHYICIYTRLFATINLNFTIFLIPFNSLFLLETVFFSYDKNRGLRKVYINIFIYSILWPQIWQKKIVQQLNYNRLKWKMKWNWENFWKIVYTKKICVYQRIKSMLNWRRHLVWNIMIGG